MATPKGARAQRFPLKVRAIAGDDLPYYLFEGRKKTAALGGMHIGPKAWEVILRRPRTGPLFPYLITVPQADRVTEFKQRCDGLGIHGVTLHNYPSRPRARGHAR